MWEDVMPILLTTGVGGLATGATFLIRKVVQHEHRIAVHEVQQEQSDAAAAARHVETREELREIKNAVSTLTSHLLERPRGSDHAR